MRNKNVFLEWFNTFLEEKNLSYENFEIEHNGFTHYIDSEVVIDLIKQAPNHEQEKIKSTIVKIDFKNGNINHFFKHLAAAYIQMNY